MSQQQAIYDQVTDLTVRTLQPVSACGTNDQFLHKVIFQPPLDAPRGNPMQRSLGYATD